MRDIAVRRASSVVMGLLALSACTGVVEGDKGKPTGMPPAPDGGMVPGPDGAPLACDGTPIADAKRMVRLSFNQISSTVHALFGDTFGQKVDLDAEIGPNARVARTFPPLASPREGSVISKTLWPTNDQIASAAGAYTLANLATVTGCGAAPTDECARTFVASFAEKAYRRPLNATEGAALTKLYGDVKALFGTVPEAIQYSVYGIMQAPQTLYRTEFGENSSEASALTPYEMASALSFFLSDAPPDQALLDAAKQGKLGTSAELATHVDRILATPSAKKNLESAMFSYFKMDNLASVKIDDAAFTSGTAVKPFSGVRESAYREGELFFSNTLWAGPLTQLLTSKKSWINSTLAAFYGITLAQPPADEATFVPVDLPATRAGLLTQSGFLASNSRPDVPSVVARGLVINAALLCAVNPSLPTDPTTAAAIEDAKRKLASATSREQSVFRTTTPPCLGCHQNFDAYGLALDSYDTIGRYRTTDPEGRPIDSQVTLPASLGGRTAKDAIDMQAQVANAPGFASCVAKNMLNWALAEGSQLTPTSCAATSVAVGFSKGDRSFSSLLREVAMSQAFMNRNAGAAQ